MNDLDRKIQAALKREPDTETPTDEPRLAEEILTAFRGRHRWLFTLLVIETLLAFAVFVWCAVRFYVAPDVTVQLRWGGLGVLALMTMAMIKIWFWMELQSNRVLREVKRVELLLVTRPPQS